MAFWKDNTASRQSPTPSGAVAEPTRLDAPSKLELAPALTRPSGPAPAPAAAGTSLVRADTGPPRAESLIAADITIEGKIEGGGSVRIAGKFKGDVSVLGDLTIEAGAKLTGGVRADKVTISGELVGNVEQASRVNLQPTAVVIGDLKAGSLTAAAGARMRGHVEFGWDEVKSAKSGKQGGDHGAESGAGS
jgi:cytoskeletal protein CcmA (bactofilin family)